MLDKEAARRIAATHINEGTKTHDGYTPVIVDEQTLEREFGWVFFYQAKEFLDTGNYRFQLAGNSPLIVDRKDGSIHVTGTAMPVEGYLSEYKRRRSS